MHGYTSISAHLAGELPYKEATLHHVQSPLICTYSMPSSTLLSDGWTFTQLPSENIPSVEENWQECTVPTSVQSELIKLGKVNHPYKGLAEWDIQCRQRSQEDFLSADDGV
jgi:hypothetical protein